MNGSGRLRRALLFVPGSEPRRFERARAVGADTVLFDLEDGVAADDKPSARAHVAAALRAGGFGAAEPAVRVNAVATPHFAADLEAVVAAGARAVMLPKTEDAAVLQAVADRLTGLEAGLGLPAGTVRLLALVETAAGVACAHALISPRLDALCFGHADFARDMGLEDADAAHGVVFHARCAVAIAARAAGVAAIDSVCLAVRDDEACRADIALGLRLGFEGKLCIHPRQVEIANQLATPTPAAVARARRVVEGWQAARAAGRAVFTLDGAMVDAPIVAAQERILERARRAGVR